MLSENYTFLNSLVIMCQAHMQICAGNIHVVWQETCVHLKHGMVPEDNIQNLKFQTFVLNLFRTQNLYADKLGLEFTYILYYALCPYII